MDDDELGQPEPAPGERRLNIQMPTELIGGTYANFANVSFSQYEFTLTFMRIEHEIEEGDVPGAVVARVNMSQRFVPELIATLHGPFSRCRGDPRPGRPPRDRRPDPRLRLGRPAGARAARDVRNAGAGRSGRRPRGTETLVALACSRCLPMG